MAIVKFSRLLDVNTLILPTFDDAGEDKVTATSVTLPLVGDRSYVLGGRFATASEEEFLQSFIKKITIVDNDAPKIPLITVTGVTAKAGELGPALTEGDAAEVIAQLFSGPDKITGSAGNDLLQVFFGLGSDTVNGGDGDDQLGFSAGADILLGGKGDDFLFSTLDGDVMTGGKGADTFVISDLDSAGSIVNDFRTAEGDKLVLDPGDIFFGNDPLVLGNGPGDFVQLAASGKSVILSVDRDGIGTFFEPEPFATIKGDLGTELDQLIADGRLAFSI